VGTLQTVVDPRAKSYLDHRYAMLAALATLECALDAARDGGGEREATRHHARGKLLARERVELLVDRDSPLLELSAVAGWGASAPVGAGVVTVIGAVEDRPCVIVATDPTVRGGAVGGWGVRKILRAQQIAHQNRLPLFCLLEPGGVEAGEQSEIFLSGGQLLVGLARLRADRIPTVGVFFGPRPDRADVAAPGDWFESLVLLHGHTVAASPDRRADDDRDAVRLARQCARHFPRRSRTAASRRSAAPEHDPEDLLGVPVSDAREIIARILDGSEFDDETGAPPEPAVCAGWGHLHGHPVAVLADGRRPAREEDTRQTARFLHRVEAAGVPLLLLRHGGPGAAAESALAAALAATTVPAVWLRVGNWDGLPAAGHGARFRFAWPNTRGGLDLAGGDPTLPGSSALHLSGRLDDDGLIDPRDTRTVLGLCLSVISGATISGAPA
jgi:acyl-CoA carboxylase subunit beta